MAIPGTDGPKGIGEAEIAREFFGVQLHYADVLSRKSGIPLAEAITYHTNFHRLFAYGNLSKQPPDPDFVALAQRVAAIPDNAARLGALITAYAGRPADPWPKDRVAFGNHFACEAPNVDGDVRIHFRNRFNKDEHGPLHASNFDQRRADLTAMFSHVAHAWPHTRNILGQSWLYNTNGYCRLFPAAYADSRKPLEGPRTFHGLSTWGQFVDFRGNAKPDVVATFKRNLATLDIEKPWRSFPFQVLIAQAPFAAFRDEYGL